MLCSRCQTDGGAVAAAAYRPGVVGLTHEWNRLGRLICRRCGQILPPVKPDLDHSSKATQLARFGLRTDRDTILEP